MTLQLLTLMGLIKHFSARSSSAATQVTIGPNSTLTINGQSTAPATTFAGQLTSPGSPNCGGLTITGGTDLTLTNTGNNYCGPTSIVQGELSSEIAVSLAPLTDITVFPAGTLQINATAATNVANSLTNNGSVIDSGLLALATTYTQAATAQLTLNFQTGAMGTITAVNNINLDGTLFVQATPTFPTAGIFPLLVSTSGLRNGLFSTFTPLGFGAADPLLAYSISQVSLYFSTCDADWNVAGNGNWGNAANNWSPPCTPGANGNTNDVANFNDLGGPTAITVFLANAAGTLPETFTLFQLNFNAVAQQYTIAQFMNGGSLIFDANGAGVPTINVNGDSPIINVPILLNKNTEMTLTDGTQLTFGTITNLTSATNQNLTITQNGPLGTGLLVNYGTLTPFGFTMIGHSKQIVSLHRSINLASFLLQAIP